MCSELNSRGVLRLLRLLKLRRMVDALLELVESEYSPAAPKTSNVIDSLTDDS